jgi:hypothetical protein
VHVFLAVAVLVLVAVVTDNVLDCPLERLVVVLCRKWYAAFPPSEEIVANTAVYLQAIVDSHP